MEWQPIETAPMNTNLLIYGEDLYGHLVVTGGKLDEYGWDVLGSNGYECETSIEPTHWAYPEAPNVEVRGDALARRPS